MLEKCGFVCFMFTTFQTESQQTINVHYEKKSIFVKVKLQHNLWHGERNVKTTATVPRLVILGLSVRVKRKIYRATFDSDKSLALTCVIIQ